LIQGGQDFLKYCLSLDLEIEPTAARLFAFAAITSDGAAVVTYKKGDAGKALGLLDREARHYRHIIGHNIIRFDLPHLVANRPNLARLGAAPIDTLWLNPLAFPRNPYHHLVKHYHDGRLNAGHVNDPALDAHLVFKVLADQIEAFQTLQKQTPDALAVYHYLSSMGESGAGFDAFFQIIRQAPRPDEAQIKQAIRRMLEGQACQQRIDQTLSRLGAPQLGWPMAYALSWISVAGGTSVMPPWVRHEFREASTIVRHLRDTSCDNPTCAWCRENNDPKKALERWFGFPAFRPEPVDDVGNSLQERIVAEVMESKGVLGILPTGTGKSICYQIPALSKFDKTGVLTVVISPLVALMGDQVEGLKRQGITSAVTVNGQMSLPERHDALDQVRMGDASILLISPEQLRSPSIRSVLQQREVGLWVLDEAHCVSKWGHDFRPDYRYIGRFIKEHSGGFEIAPILCLTATAKPEVVKDIQEHFSERVGQELMLLDGGAVRTNLTFEIRETTRGKKLADIVDIIECNLPPEGLSGAIIYCATRKTTEKVAEFLVVQGISADRFHAGLNADEKTSIQERFRVGGLRVIAATNAFGMGIDKPDIRLVIHFDIPGSLENYLQEAGRAGRDRQQAKCVLLFNDEDVERQFSLTARSRLAQHEISAILKALRRMASHKGQHGEIVATPGEILREEKDQEFEKDSATDDTRVKTAVSWLEEATILTREENRVQVFPSSLRVRTLLEARNILNLAEITIKRRKQLLKIVEYLMNAPADKGVSTDELVGASGLSNGGLLKALNDLEVLGIATDDTTITAFVHLGVENASPRLFASSSQLETELIALMREGFPDADNGEPQPLHLVETCQALRDIGYTKIRPDMIETILQGPSHDGRDQDGGRGNIHLRKLSRNTIQIRLQRSWEIVEKTADIRRRGAELLLSHLIGKVAQGKRGKDLQVETTLGNLQAGLSGDVFLSDLVKDNSRLMNRALLWLHEHSIISLGKGLSVFRPAITVHLGAAGKKFLRKDFEPLEEHYAEQTVQTHVMAAYAHKGLVTMSDALRLSEDYFVLDKTAFIRRWLPGRGPELRRQTTSASWNTIVKSLENPVQEAIVADEREQTNVLVLAGPGSGKTRVLVHRIAYLIRVRREEARGILVLTYNRHAAAEIRERLKLLIGNDAAPVTVSTCHALAMRLMGVSFAGKSDAEMPRDFDGIVMEAVRQLSGEGMSRSEADALRDTLIQGYRWILVDEYQDIGPEEYALIGAVAGRSIEDPEMKISLFAVGDDDQNIYSFAGASIEFIRKFEEEYAAKPIFLTENYRSTRSLIDAANLVISPATGRMKTDHDIRINDGRKTAVAGGNMAAIDPVAQGRVQILQVPDETAQAVAAVDELYRLSLIVPDWSWASTAIIARDWRLLQPVRSYAEAKGIPVELASDSAPTLWRLCEMQDFIGLINQHRTELLSLKDLVALHNTLPRNKWSDLILQGMMELNRELANKPAPAPDIIQWFGEWSRDMRGMQKGLMLLTAHRAKGLEFDHVITLDGGWDRTSSGEDPDAPRRLFYVAMTRARTSFSALSLGPHRFLDATENPELLIREPQIDPDARPLCEKRYQTTDPKLVDLSFPGRLSDHSRSLTAIRDVAVGDVVTLIAMEDKWVINNRDGVTIGRMSRAYAPPVGATFLSGEVGAILRWRKSDSGEDYQHMMRRDEWDVVLPEFVFL
jgi:ATP-dependent DNA helicase RecQ